MNDELDRIEELESKKTGHVLPMGWPILFWALIIWGIFYMVAYTPVFSGWTQEKAYQESLK